MRNANLGSVKDCEVIFAHDHFVILSGKIPRLFHKDGSFVAKYKTIRKAYAMTFLPGNLAFLDGLLDGAYHFLSLETGELLWSHLKKGKRDFTPRKFAVTNDGNIVYYVYSIKDILHVDQLILSEKSCTTYTIPFAKGATYHCYCDERGYLCILRSFLLPKEQEDGRQYAFCGVLQWHPDDKNPTWKYQWTVPTGTPDCSVCMCNDEYVLLESLKVRNLKTGEMFFLLENQKEMVPPFGAYTVKAYDKERNLLTIRFTWSCSNVVIDCKARKIVAHYVPFDRDHSSGCLIDDEFWMGSDEGVVKRPFPHMDPFPREF